MELIVRFDEIPPDLLDFFEPIPDKDNLSDCWRIAAEPLQAKHYAAFPSELVYRALAAGTSQKGYCPACGMPWARVVETKSSYEARKSVAGRPVGGDVHTGHNGTHAPGVTHDLGGQTTTLGWKPSCNCIGADCLTPRAGLVLDPFSGSQRVGLQAARLGLDYLGIELSEEYCRMGERILQEQGMSLFNDVTVSHPDVR